MDLRITTERGTDTITTTVDGRRIEREEKWHIAVIEPRGGTVRQVIQQDEEPWTRGERVAAGAALVALVMWAWYVPFRAGRMCACLTSSRFG